MHHSLKARIQEKLTKPPLCNQQKKKNLGVSTSNNKGEKSWRPKHHSSHHAHSRQQKKKNHQEDELTFIIVVSKPLTQKIQDDKCNLSSSSYNLCNKKNHDNERCARHCGIRDCNTKSEPRERATLIVLVL